MQAVRTVPKTDFPRKHLLGYFHGMKNTPEYAAWKGMKQRCYNPHNPSFADYGGRGIVVCKRWTGKNGFRNFISDLGLKPFPKNIYSLDRFPNNDGNYEPGNTQWRTQTEQNNNRRRAKRQEGSSVFVGVSESRGAFRSYIYVSGKQIYLGLFTSKKSAALAYDHAAVKYHGKNADLNFPKEAGLNLSFEKYRSHRLRPSSSRYRGVSWAADRKVFRVRIFVRRRNLNLGNFTSETTAARAYDTAAIKYFGKQAHLNFPRGAR
jgi:hypothetical protein